MLWTAALLSLIVWAIGLESGFLGVSIHVFLLLSLLAVLAALLPPGPVEGAGEESAAGAGDEPASPRPAATGDPDPPPPTADGAG